VHFVSLCFVASLSNKIFISIRFGYAEVQASDGKYMLCISMYKIVMLFKSCVRSSVRSMHN